MLNQVLMDFVQTNLSMSRIFDPSRLDAVDAENDQGPLAAWATMPMLGEQMFLMSELPV